MDQTSGKPIKAKRHAVVDLGVCVACGACAEVCPREAISIWKGSYSVVDNGRCVGCGRCAKECPATAIRIEAKA
ncbi:MAG: 4Fe-4S binding protein [bacterium]|nr:4Fe-4S binding protein [bacterium]